MLRAKQRVRMHILARDVRARIKPGPWEDAVTLCYGGEEIPVGDNHIITCLWTIKEGQIRTGKLDVSLDEILGG